MTPAALTEALTQDWVHGEHVDARGIRLSDPFDLDARTLCSFDLSSARFEHGLTARRAVFRGMSWLQHATITGTCDLSSAVFRNDLRLDGLTCDLLILSGARFEGVLSLDNARIGSLILTGSLCLANLSLSGTVVTEQADLSDSTLMGGVWARGAALSAKDLTGATVDGRRVGL